MTDRSKVEQKLIENIIRITCCFAITSNSCSTCREKGGGFPNCFPDVLDAHRRISRLLAGMRVSKTTIYYWDNACWSATYKAGWRKVEIQSIENKQEGKQMTPKRSKCPTCGKVSKRIIGGLGWYYCRNLSCNMTAYYDKQMSIVAAVSSRRRKEQMARYFSLKDAMPLLIKIECASKGILPALPAPRTNKYYCSRCESYHYIYSNIGNDHRDFKAEEAK